MKRKVPQDTGALERHLREQIGFLERSADAFDEGYEDEAKRLAVTIRTLVHDTSVSHSLLSQLGCKDVDFCDSAFESDSSSLISYAGLAAVAAGPEGVKHTSRLDGNDPTWFRWIDFKTWWNATVIRDREGHELTRRDLVLAVRNQDGGAHVDPVLDEEYARLSRDNSLGRYSGEPAGMKPLSGAELVSIRQIAHELLKTLKPGYTKKPRPDQGAIIGDVQVFFEPARQNATVELGRNDPCHCGSGKKFKRCHGRST